LPAPQIIDGLALMGAKYLPTVKDLKASKRFQQKQNTQSKFITTSGTPPAKKHKKK
jgi:hypothetical protein